MLENVQLAHRTRPLLEEPLVDAAFVENMPVKADGEVIKQNGMGEMVEEGAAVAFAFKGKQNVENEMRHGLYLLASCSENKDHDWPWPPCPEK